MSITELSPPLADDRTAIEAPVVEVTLLEDRAQVVRRGTVSLDAGVQRLAIVGVAPVLQDVSLQATCSAGEVSVARVVRAWRIQREDRPADVRELEDELRQGQDHILALEQRMERATDRLSRLHTMLGQAAAEVPVDAAWGRVDPDAWRHSFGTLFQRAREERRTLTEAWLDGTDRVDDLSALHRRLAQRLRPDVALAAVAEVDVLLEAPAEVELEVRYVVPSALWRPLHRASLHEGASGPELRWTRRAALWQHSGEDWVDATIYLSTARSGLGTEPPRLSDDLLTVQRREDTVTLEARDVAVQSTGPGAASGGRRDDSVTLPGVDDGGEVQRLAVPVPTTVPSDGRPVLVDLETSTAGASVERICLPEVLPRVVVRATGTNPGPAPLLPGPVELLRGGGPFGWAEVDFTAPGAAFELSFGPDDEVRVQREAKTLHTKKPPADKTTRRKVQVRVDLSHVGTTDCTVHLTERVPVSEVEELSIQGVTASPEATPDADGFLRWALPMEADSQQTITLTYVLVAAPGVQLPG